MGFIVSLIDQFGVWLWFALAVALLVLENIVPGVHFVWFGMAAAVVGVLALLIPMAWEWQLILFAVISVLTVFWVRRSYRADALKTDEPNLNVRGAEYIGRRVTVEEPIKNGRGKVRVGDTVWVAQGEDAPLGSQVKVTGVNGTVLVVANSS